MDNEMFEKALEREDLATCQAQRMNHDRYTRILGREPRIQQKSRWEYKKLFHHPTFDFVATPPYNMSNMPGPFDLKEALFGDLSWIGEAPRLVNIEPETILVSPKEWDEMQAGGFPPTQTGYTDYLMQKFFPELTQEKDKE